ncbi:MAG: hypothetical protein A2V70_19435 [Planctomycetes bacterium RBG_13_63_9]|nr:MAG: hypothetical protein A2V70_19435 [Planctomycetes bacterium RBG_13_63_9]HXK37158.1 hypothetical protein [Candidatus Paceibacterota bacterium]
MERQYKYQSRYTANWDRVPKVEGEVVDKGSLTVKGKRRPFLKVRAEDGEVTVFETAGLAELFAASDVGDQVSIEYLGTVETAKGHQFRQFRALCWSDSDGAEPMAAPARRGRKPREQGTSRRSK